MAMWSLCQLLLYSSIVMLMEKTCKWTPPAMDACQASGDATGVLGTICARPEKRVVAVVLQTNWYLLCSCTTEYQEGRVISFSLFISLQKCPTFLSVSPADQLISIGQPQKITLAGKNLPTHDTTYWCTVTIGNDASISVEATRYVHSGCVFYMIKSLNLKFCRNENNVTCHSTSYNYSEVKL